MRIRRTIIAPVIRSILPCHSPFLLCSLLPARAPDFSLTGFWFSLSADYGLEKPENKTVKASSSLARMRDML